MVSVKYTIQIPTTDINAIYQETLTWLQHIGAKIEEQYPPTHIKAKHGGIFKLTVMDPNYRKTIVVTLNRVANFTNAHITAETFGAPFFKSMIRKAWWQNLFVQLQARLLYRFQQPAAEPPPYLQPPTQPAPPTPVQPEKGILQQDWTPDQTPQPPVQPASQPQASYCNNCGSELPEGTSLCPVCGNQN